jgi:hypothetical protein
MGWQQYSRPLWLSRGNHYILYLKAMTVQMRLSGFVFHSGRLVVLRVGYILRAASVSYRSKSSRGLNLFSGLPRTSVLSYRRSPLSGWCSISLALYTFRAGT